MPLLVPSLTPPQEKQHKPTNQETIESYDRGWRLGEDYATTPDPMDKITVQGTVWTTSEPGKRPGSGEQVPEEWYRAWLARLAASEGRRM